MNMEEIIRDRGNPVCKNDTRAVVRHYLKFMHTTINAARKRKDLAAEKIHLRKMLDKVAKGVDHTRTFVNQMLLFAEKHEANLLNDEKNGRVDEKYCLHVETFNKELELESIELDEEELALKAAEALLETIVEPI